MTAAPLATGRVTAVCLAATSSPDAGRVGRTGIDKRPQTGPVPVGPLGLAGDTVCDTDHHGGPDQAVYVYADADADDWVAELGREIPPGTFGENLRTATVDVCGAVVGERWQVGEPGAGPLLEATSPRSPCATFQRHLGEYRWVRRFTEHGAPGTYFRVVTPGRVAVGDTVAVVSRPDHGVTVRDWFTAGTPEMAEALLGAERDGHVRLHRTLRREAQRAVGRTAGSATDARPASA